jgi:DHA1 family multidrug resistance protein-like MFS transporter
VEVKGPAVHSKTLKYSLFSASALALAGLGDAFLYVYLPSNYKSLGLAVFWVGIILSVNRFTRLILNSQVAYYLSKLGLKKIAIATTILAALTTFSYGFINSIVLWLIVRVLWGLVFSTLRLSSIIYALKHPKQGISLGLGKSITETGSVLALLIGPALLLRFDRAYTFMIFTLLTSVGILITIALPAIKTEPLSKKELRLSFPSALNILVLLNTFVVEGMIVVLIGRLLMGELQVSAQQVLAIAGVCLIFFSPLAGWLADMWGFRVLFNYTNLFLILGIALIAFGFIVPGLIIVFTFSAMNASVAPGSALTNSSSLVKDVSDNVTWRDMGAACGTLVGSLLLNFPDLHSIFMWVLIPMVTILIVQFIHSKSKTIYNGVS